MIIFMKKVAVNLQNKLLFSIFRSPLSWFNTTPSGQILTRTNKDQDEVDINLPLTFNYCITNFISLFSYILIVSIVFPYFIILSLFVIVIYSYFINKYIKVAIQLKRLEVKTYKYYI